MEQQRFRMHWLAFFLAFAVGISYVYFVHPAPKVVIKYPTPYNAGKITYQDDGESCYQYKATKVTCPKEGVLPQPISSA